MSGDSGGRGQELSRRALLGRAGAAGAFIALPDVLGGVAAQAQARPRPIVREPVETLTSGEADVLEAIVARLIPSDPDVPGAAEARATHYIDRALGGFLAPFLDAYRAGLAAVDAYATASKGKGFSQLAAADQDAVLRDMERNAASGFDGGAAAFFTLVLGHTLQGTFCDPFYGGNRNFVGWDLIGYPGVRLAVTPEQQNLGAKLTPTHMSAYDYSMFARRKPARAALHVPHDSHGD